MKYSDYQDSGEISNQASNQPDNKQVTSSQQTNNKQVTTIEEGKKERRLPPLPLSAKKKVRTVARKGEGKNISTPTAYTEFCDRFKMKLDEELDDNELAHLLAVKREQASGSKIYDAVALAKKRAKSCKAELADLRTVQAWLYPPPSPNKCHCNGRLKSEYAPGSGLTSLICELCGRSYAKR